jgi:glutamate/tyrosine decarboxylase-like PLP-dependent enzyme
MPSTKRGTTLPEIGKPHEEILARLEEMRHSDVKWKDGRVWSLVYYVDEEHLELINKAFKLYLSENMLNPYAWDSLRHMEKEIKLMAIDLLNGDNETVGVITSGGTEVFFKLFTLTGNGPGKKSRKSAILKWSCRYPFIRLLKRPPISWA